MLQLSNFEYREMIQNFAKRMTNHPQKGHGYVHVTNFCMSNCGRHDMLLAEINNAVDDGPLFVSPLTVDASAAIH